MKFDINTTLDNLLELWVNNTFLMWSGMPATKEVIEEQLEIGKILETNGVTNIEIFEIDEKVYTLRIKLNGNQVIKKIRLNI
jgi:hypothetical protein